MDTRSETFTMDEFINLVIDHNGNLSNEYDTESIKYDRRNGLVFITPKEEIDNHDNTTNRHN